MVSSPLSLEHALLGFLRQHSMYPYEIYQTLAQARELGRVWHLKQSQLYALLTRLEEAGYISSTTESHGTRPPRKIMSLTPSGLAAFDAWTLAPVSHGRDFRLEFLAKLYFASQSGPNAVTSLVDRQLQSCEGWLVDLDSEAAAVQGESQFDWLVLQFRIDQINAIISWLGTCAETLGGEAT
jgi:PadR family transcriptional regulator, regulatory protein AphA